MTLSRRTVLAAALLAPVVRSCPAWGLSPFSAAIRRAEAADALYLRSGLASSRLDAAGLPCPVRWMAYRETLRDARALARMDLHALTPATPDEAAALVAYYEDRAAISGGTVSLRAARKRLRKLFKRPGACRPP